MSVPAIEPTAHYTSCPETKLWAAVIATVVMDAETGLKAIKYGVKKHTDFRGNYHLDQALYILGTEWFETICGFLDIHPDWILKLIQHKASELGLSLKGIGDPNENSKRPSNCRRYEIHRRPVANPKAHRR